MNKRMSKTEVIHLFKQRGFAFIELLIVIGAVGILASIALSSYAAFQAKTRDTMRQTAINAIATQLEACYNATCNGTYPLLLQLQDTSMHGWVATYLKSLDIAALYDSKGVKIQSGEPSVHAEYAYLPMKNDGTPCIANGDTCKSYILEAWQEQDAAHVYKQASRNK